MIHAQIECPLYNEVVLFYSGCTPRQLKAHLKKKYKVVDSSLRIDSKDLGMLHSGTDTYILWCRHQEDIPTLIHEVYHLCVKIMSVKGVPISVENDEAMAYYIAYWTSQLLPLVRKV